MQGQKQIPYGDDNKKSQCNDKKSQCDHNGKGV
jgi:hypothetical protein